PLVESVSVVFVAVFSGCIALDDIYCNSLLLCLKGCFNDPRSMTLPSYKGLPCFLGQHLCNLLC
ncbi:hypothetical protein EWB00_006830, partial [Schistosoma japonicum]